MTLGYADGERIGKDELFLAVKKIADSLTVPLSVDIESGFGRTESQLTDTVRRVVAAGGVGINIEDISNFESKTLFAVETQVDRVRTVRRVSDSLGIPLVINARTDAYRYAVGDGSAGLEEAIRRTKAYSEAGADCLYPMGLAERDGITTFVKAANKPVNIMARKGVPSISELERIGVRRLSLGPGPMYATMGLLRKIAQELKQNGTYESMLAGAITYGELNALAERKRAS